MTQSDLETVVAKGAPSQLLWLVSADNPDVEQRDAYRELVVRIAAGEAPMPTPETQPPSPPAARPKLPAELRNATKLGASRCWFSDKTPACGCAGLHCHLLGRQVNIYDCVECLRKW